MCIDFNMSVVASFNNFVAFIGVAVFQLFFVTSASAIVETTFFLLPSPPYGPNRLTTGWTAASLSSCVQYCMLLFPADCHGAMYNSATSLCTPAGWMDETEAPPTTVEGNLYITYQCDPTQGFNVHTYGNTRVCINYPKIWGNHTVGDEYCRARDSYLYTVRTLEKLYLMQPLVEEKMYIGLNDIETEGVYKWDDNGEIYDFKYQTELFLPDKPSQIETGWDCIVINKLDPRKLDSYFCDINIHFVCEKPLFGKNITSPI